MLRLNSRIRVLNVDIGTSRLIFDETLSEFRSLGAKILNVSCLYLVLAKGTINGPLCLTRGTSDWVNLQSNRCCICIGARWCLIL